MNKVLALTWCVLAASCANHNTSIKKSISLKENKMRLEFRSVVDGHKEYDYDQTFDVTGFSKEQTDALVKHISDSLGIR